MTRLGRQFQLKKPILGIRDMARRRRIDRAPPEVVEEVWRNRSGPSWIDGYWKDFRSPRRDHLMGKGFASPRQAIHDLPVPGAADSGLLVLDLRDQSLRSGGDDG